MPIFCFHSVRNKLAIPNAAAFPSQAHRDEFEKYLAVDSGWFYQWVEKAHLVWGSALQVTFDDGFGDVLIPASVCAGMGIKTTVFVPTAYIGQSFPYAPIRVVTDQEIRWMAMQGVIVGSHGHVHLPWTERGDGDVEFDIKMSLDHISMLTAMEESQPVEPPIAPPHGKFLPEHVEMVGDLGGGMVYGTNIFPAGQLNHCHWRWLANMSGYVKYGETEEVLWDWKD